MPPFSRSRLFRVAAIAALLAALYALAGFWLAPKLLRSTLLEQIPKTFVGVKPSVGEIHVNPFLLRVEIHDFSLSDANGAALAGFRRLLVDFDVSSIWHRAYTFGRIELDTPQLNAIVAPDGRLNLLQLTPAPSVPNPAARSREQLPAVRIGEFRVSRGSVSYDDRSRASNYALKLAPIEFELRDFSTGVDGGRFTFTGSSSLGERIAWRGHVTVQPIASEGELQIDGLQAHTLWAYLKDQLNFQVNSGRIALKATYHFSLQDTLGLQLEVPAATLTDLAVRPNDADSDWISVPQLSLSGAGLDLAKRQAHANALTLTGIKLLTWIEPDGSLNLMKLAASPGPAAHTAPAAAPAPAWTLDLREFAIRGAQISAEDRGTRPAAKVQLAQLSLTVSGISQDLAKPVNVALETRINDQGSLRVSGEVTPQPVSGTLAATLAAIDLTAVQPYLAQRTSMTLTSGALSGDLKLRFGTRKPALQVAGNLSVAHLRSIDNALHQDFINWERLDLQGLKFQRDPDQLRIDQIAALKLYARVIVEPDGTTNVARILAAPGATVTAPVGASGTQQTVTASVAPAPVAHAPARAPGRSARSPTQSTATLAATTPRLPIQISKVTLRAGETDFADLSVTPNFAAGIQKLEGSVLGLSSQQSSRAKIDLHGAVDAFSPVEITGDINLLAPALYADLAMSFRNIELSTFNPYSGRFAGYNIAKGKLTTEMTYKVEGRHLDAQHHITVDQLEFGAKTESKDAVSLPIKFAVALLKDRNGVINLELPVTGSLDDPKFRLGPIIWKVFVNLLGKAVTAPFKLLSSLFGGGPDLQFIDFKPGVADLNPAAIEKTRTVVKALAARPQLRIEVPIAVVSELDRPKLVEAKFQAQIHDAQAAASGSRKSAAGAPVFESLEPAARLTLLTEVYSTVLGGPPKFPEEITSIKAKPESVDAKIGYLSDELHRHISIAESELTQLGKQRAANLQQALLTDASIAPERVFLVANDKAKNQGGVVRLELSLR